MARKPSREWKQHSSGRNSFWLATMFNRVEILGIRVGEMRIFSAAALFGTVGVTLFTLTSPGIGETALSFEPLVRPPYDTALVRSDSCPPGNVLKVTGAIRGLDRRRNCVPV